MSKHPKAPSKYRFGPINSLEHRKDPTAKLSALQSIEIPQTDTSILLKSSNKEGTRQKSRRIGELEEDSEIIISPNRSIEMSQETDVSRPFKKARLISSDDSTVFWKASPRQKRIKQVLSSPSKTGDDSLLNDESIADIFHDDLSPEKFKKQPSNSTTDIQPNNLNQSILQSLKTIKETTKSQDIDKANINALLDGNISNLLQQIGTSMLIPEGDLGTVQRTSTIEDSFKSFNETSETIDNRDTVESDEFSDDGENDNLILQLTQRATVRNNEASLMTKDNQSDIFSDDIDQYRLTVRTTTEATEIENENDSFSDDDDIPLISKMNSFSIFNTEENLAKCAIKNPLLHRFQIREINIVQYKLLNSTKEQKVLKCLSSDDSMTAIIVRDFWFELGLKPLDIIHIITSDESDDFKLVDKDHNLLIWNPDELVSPTKIGSATYCVREAVINDKFKSPGAVSEAFIIGNITHSLFQSCLKHKKTDDEYIQSFINQKLDDNELNIYSVESSRDEIKKIILTNATYIKSWINLYVGPSSERSTSEFKVSKILDIEENIISPAFGLRGFIDVVIEATLSTGRFVVPLEIKSGKEYLSNKAQVAMYTLLIRDRYQVKSILTDLVYTKMKTNHLDEVKLTDLKHLIQLRNSLSQYMVYGQTSFPPLKQKTSCERCFSLEPCMVINKLVEEGTKEGSGIDIDLYSTLTDHLDKPIYVNFFQHWNTLITKEEGFLKYNKCDLWKYTSIQRESNGGLCIGGLKLEKCDYSTHSRQYVYEFRRPTNGLVSKIGKYDSVILSDDSGDQVGIADCSINYIDSDCIILSSKRRWIDSTVKCDGFNVHNNQVFESVFNENPLVISPQVANKTFRIDKNSFAMGLSTARWNILNLFLPNGDVKRRELIVDLREPEFGNPQWEEKYQDFNEDQRKALEVVSRTQDYSLILGMPGTGKTTVISHMIKTMIEKGKNVLITSYTHSAVDNICEKLIDLLGPGISLLRLGSADKIHSKVQPYSLYSDDFLGDISTKDSYQEIIKTRKIIAATCLGVTDGLFERTFDYCIVDEASQVALPVVLGPIQYADKFILVGDHYQLPPLVVNPEARTGGLDKSLFQLLNDAYPHHVVELTNQYRMNEDIMKISNDLVYKGRLRCGTEEVARRQLDIKCSSDCSDWVREVMKPERRVTFVDYDGVNGVKELKNGDQIENPGECELIKELIENMVISGVKVKDIGLMSFYNGQLLRFRRKLPEHLVEKLEMLTADKFQGRDKDVIIISLVRTEGIGGLLKEMRRINVAMTRAKRKLIVFGHGGLIRKEVPLMMDAFESRCWVIKPHEVEVSDQDGIDKLTGRAKSQIRTRIKGDIINSIIAEMEN